MTGLAQFTTWGWEKLTCLDAQAAPGRVDKARILLIRRKEDEQLLSRYSALSAMAVCQVFPEVIQVVQFSNHETLRCQVSCNYAFINFVFNIRSTELEV